MIPYSKPNTTDREIWADVMSTLKSGQIDPGRKHEEFRSRLADLWDVPLNWVLLTNSCTTALTLALRDYMSICAPILTWPSENREGMASQSPGGQA